MSTVAEPDPRPVRPAAGPLDATVELPGSKSFTNRALVTAALAEGTSSLEGVLFADDTEAMLDSLARLGIGLEIDRTARRVVVAGTGGRVPPGPERLDARLSGTTARFLGPMLALGAGPYVLDGGAPLRARPMADGFDALRALGVVVTEEGAPGHLPVVISGGPRRGGTVRVPGEVSSQFLSGLLLAAPCFEGGLTVELTGALVSRPYVEMTLATMRAFGSQADWAGPGRIVVTGGGYRATAYRIEPDASAASYFFAAAAVCGGRVRVEGLGEHAVQGDVRFVDVLERMGAEVRREADAIEVRGTGVLHGVRADFADISDTAQTIAAVAVFADAPTEITGIGFIRGKETDRIAAVVTELRRCGIDATETDDGFRIVPGTPRPTTIATYDDHRMAMSFALLGLRVPGIAIADPGCVAKTFPGYWEALERLTVPRTGADG